MALTISVVTWLARNFDTLASVWNPLSDEKSFDYEIYNEIQCTVTVEDENAEVNIPQRAGESFRIQIIDENDNLPEFTEEIFIFNISESTIVGSVIGSMTYFNEWQW